MIKFGLGLASGRPKTSDETHGIPRRLDSMTIRGQHSCDTRHRHQQVRAQRCRSDGGAGLGEVSRQGQVRGTRSEEGEEEEGEEEEEEEGSLACQRDGASNTLVCLKITSTS